MNLLCLAIDRLHVGYLGCYGSTWVATPAFDRLASTGFVFDQTIVDSLDLATVYDSWWRGTHAAAAKSIATSPTFAEIAKLAGLKTLLASDDAAVLEHLAGLSFDDVLELPASPIDAPSAGDVNATHAAQIFATISERIAELSEPFAAWIHVGTLGGAWDAPVVFRERYRDEDDPPIPTFTALQSQTLPHDVDLDDRFAIAMAYAGQVSLVDACLGGLLEHLEETGLDRRTAIVVCSPRGLALGEHREVGFHDRRFYAENVHVPMLLRLPDGRGQLRRSHALVQPCDLLPTIANLLASNDRPQSAFGRSLVPLIEGTAVAVRDRAVVVGTTETALRTPHWSLRVAKAVEDNEPESVELFVKPDDFWEVNDVADRAAGAVDELQQCRESTLAAMAGEEPLPPLPAAEWMYDAV